MFNPGQETAMQSSVLYGHFLDWLNPSGSGCYDPGNYLDHYRGFRHVLFETLESLEGHASRLTNLENLCPK